MAANAREERIKLTATYLNGLAIAVMAVGGFAPLVSGAPNAAAVAVCLVISIALTLRGAYCPQEARRVIMDYWVLAAIVVAFLIAGAFAYAVTPR